jgi:hypothetical protein
MGPIQPCPARWGAAVGPGPRVVGFHKWLELGRHVTRGSKGIAILAPIVSRTKVEDEATGKSEPRPRWLAEARPARVAPRA